ncbi:hypothetical protein DYBT9275_00024 [Dyadobacter sp. CECT 9275]|uniref:LTXXQ motif family protein n=1 Tax=Dyadobacter helix TaxID=2822344 RepID=A0A916J7K5_9BACT|nr:hypothetical protein [Dyadobacter sp. CECT 9275]CAG4988190.1 hypothetical protein DYBT9275_00024 [Dyadobacter sp. CECT 9275]
MRKYWMAAMISAGLIFTGCASSNQGISHDSSQYEETSQNSKLNNRRLEKNLEKYKDELHLTKKQVKQLKKIDRRYARKDRKLSRDDDARRRDHRQLAEQKREEMLDVLTREQQDQLQALIKKGRFSFDQWFGK